MSLNDKYCFDDSIISSSLKNQYELAYFLKTTDIEKERRLILKQSLNLRPPYSTYLPLTKKEFSIVLEHTIKKYRLSVCQIKYLNTKAPLVIEKLCNQQVRCCIL